MTPKTLHRKWAFNVIPKLYRLSSSFLLSLKISLLLCYGLMIGGCVQNIDRKKRTPDERLYMEAMGVVCGVRHKKNKLFRSTCIIYQKNIRWYWVIVHGWRLRRWRKNILHWINRFSFLLVLFLVLLKFILTASRWARVVPAVSSI